MAGVISLVLERDGHDQPWGFRLQGGSDVAMPLSVQRVLVGSPADGTLLKADIITRISCTETKGITHQQAADLFNNAGNQIAINIKRAGLTGVPVGGVPATTAPLVNGAQPSSVPVAGHTTANSSSEPYRTLPLVQPTAKVYQGGDLGAGSVVHLKMQDEHISGVREPKASPESQTVAAKAKHDEIVMKHKVAVSLEQIQQSQQSNSVRLSPNPEVFKQQYNTPLPLYSAENVQEAMIMPVSPTHTPTINPSPTPINKPTQVILTPSKDYNPQSSATWRALQESSDTKAVDPEKVASYTAMKEHDPIYSEIYAAPVAPKPGQRPPPRTNTLPGPRSPVSDLLPPNFKSAVNNAEVQSAPRSLLSPPKIGASLVREATLTESKQVNHQMTSEPVRIPLYEDEYDEPVVVQPRRPGGPKTNSIGGRKKIAQTASFNKLMMDVLGE